MSNIQKQKIITIATPLFLRQGIRNITMDDIARAGGMSKKTIYKYFRSKEDIAEAVLDTLVINMITSFDSNLQELWNQNPIAGIKQAGHMMARLLNSANDAYLEDLRRYYPNLWNKVLQARRRRYTLLEHMLMDAQAQGHIRQDLNLAVTKSIFEAAIETIMNPDFLLENSLSFQQAMDYLIDILLKGVQMDD